ncbi:MAG: hypothetical protein E6K72_01355 [Candidatus Eisenbacteria bacterium]|uniref:Uncharacterized protein n=1 Tax=Eiseniibacteriota bacterium TaxID=2212470 RepID=A0A538T8A5_UNCEI|nr:MAG: hypothetical protein E6K72_01355 [Candidatus Eisenbacteria bacterium]
MNFMRRLTAFAIVALVALTMALAVLGCGKKEEPAATTPASEAPPAGSMGSDSTSMMADTSMHH